MTVMDYLYAWILAAKSYNAPNSQGGEYSLYHLGFDLEIVEMKTVYTY